MTTKKRISSFCSCSRVAVALLALAFGLGCGSRASDSRSTSQAKKILADTLIQAALVPSQNAIAWTFDDRGRITSYWLRGNAVRMEYAGARPDLLIPLEGALWKWRETDTERPLCDCDAWKLEEWLGECPAREEPGSAKEVDMVELVSGKESALYRPSQSEPESDFTPSEYSSEVLPLASVGPYLFVTYKESVSLCRTERASVKEGYFVFDLEKGEKVEILSNADKAGIDAVERRAAFDSAQGAAGPSVAPSELELVAVEPGYDFGFGLRVSYLFAAKVVDDSPEGSHRTSYRESISVPGQTMPQSLAPFAVPPAVVNAFAKGALGLRPGGWGLVAGSDEQLAGVWAAFAKH